MEQVLDDDVSIGEESILELIASLKTGDADEIICIVPMKDGRVDRIRFFIGPEGYVRRSLL